MRAARGTDLPAETPGSLRVVAVRPDRPEDHATAEYVLAGPLVARRDLGGPRGASACNGEQWQANGWYLKNRSSRRYEHIEHAMMALDSLYAVRRALGELTPE